MRRVMLCLLAALIGCGSGEDDNSNVTVNQSTNNAFCLILPTGEGVLVDEDGEELLSAEGKSFPCSEAGNDPTTNVVNPN